MSNFEIIIICITIYEICKLYFKYKCEHEWETIEKNNYWDGYNIITKVILKCKHCGKVKCKKL